MDKHNGGHIEAKKHIEVGRYVKDVVFAANDGIITTFAVVAGTIGAGLSPVVILIIGFANLLADGFSMATGNFLGSKSERDFYEKEEKVEKREVKKSPEIEKEEVRILLSKKGYEGEKLEQLVELIASNEEFWIQFMMHEELKLFSPDIDSPVKNGAVTFVSFVSVGLIPLLPYLIIGRDVSFSIPIIFTASALFIVGALRKFFSEKSWFWLGLEMLIVGGLAAIIAFFVGSVLGGIIR